MQIRFKGISVLALGFGLLLPAGSAIAQSQSERQSENQSMRQRMRHDAVPDVCDYEYSSDEGNCRLFRLDVDSNYSYWNFDDFRNGTDVMFTTNSTSYDVEDGFHYYQIIYKWVNGTRYDASGTCITDTPAFRQAVCQQGDYTYRYRY